MKLVRNYKYLFAMLGAADGVVGVVEGGQYEGAGATRLRQHARLHGKNPHHSWAKPFVLHSCKSVPSWGGNFCVAVISQEMF